MEAFALKILDIKNTLAIVSILVIMENSATKKKVGKVFDNGRFIRKIFH